MGFVPKQGFAADDSKRCSELEHATLLVWTAGP